MKKERDALEVLRRLEKKCKKNVEEAKIALSRPDELRLKEIELLRKSAKEFADFMDVAANDFMGVNNGPKTDE